MKTCRVCNVQKNETRFIKSEWRKIGNNRPRCKKCDREYHRKRNPSVRGFVYILINKAWPEWVKIGCTTNIENRLRGLNACSPYRDFKIFAFFQASDQYESELFVHEYLDELNVERKREWFKIDSKIAKALVENRMEQG